MKLEITDDWLARKLAQADDDLIGAGGTGIEQLRKEAEFRTVTPTVFAEVCTDLGRVVRFVREQRGWSQQQLAEIASIDASEVGAIETKIDCQPSPRAIVYLADALGLSRARLKELVGFVVTRTQNAANETTMQFAAQSKRNVEHITTEEYDALRELVELLTKKRADEE